MLRAFLRSTKGNFALTTAVVMPAIIGTVGLSVDVAHLLDVKSRLQNAADIGVVVASRGSASVAERNSIFEDYLNANFERNGASITRSSIEIDAGINHLSIDGRVTASVELFFMQHIGVKHVSVAASTYRSTKSMEIAIVLDNTGSMGSGGISALKKASHALVNAVETGRAPNQDVRISLVPFVTAVNIKGVGFDADWIDTTGQALYNGWNFLDEGSRQRRLAGERLSQPDQGKGDDQSGSGKGGGKACKNKGQGAPAIARREQCLETEADADPESNPHHLYLFEQAGAEWKGCVEARPHPYNLSTDAPEKKSPETLFVPYFAPDEPGNRMSQGGNNAAGFNNSWLDDAVEGTEEERQRSTTKYMSPAEATINDIGPLTIGPNRACPTPVVPLTTDFSKIRSAINDMKYWNGSGTNIAEGIAWGWRVLSPEAPYTEAGEFDSNKRTKYLVLMTDGRNVSYGASATINRSDYGAYGFLVNGLIAGTTNQGKAESKLNEWTLEICTKMKEQDIEIFTVVYNEKAASVHAMFRSCATRPENFHMANNTVGLEEAFSNIGRQISRLRLTQ